MTSTPAPSQDEDLTAAEYVLGVQDAETRAVLERRIKHDAVFAAQVGEWEVRLARLNDEYAEEPAPNLLHQIEARLFPKPIAVPRKRFAWFGIAAGAAIAAAFAIAVVLIAVPARAPLAPVLTTLASADVTYEVRADSDTLLVTRIAGNSAPEGKVHELWLIVSGEAPVSLGLLEEAPLRAAYKPPTSLWALTVSLEPTGGTPRVMPSGPVILARIIGG